LEAEQPQIAAWVGQDLTVARIAILLDVEGQEHALLAASREHLRHPASRRSSSRCSCVRWQRSGPGSRPSHVELVLACYAAYRFPPCHIEQITAA
jgi:hypothetical protein